MIYKIFNYKKHFFYLPIYFLVFTQNIFSQNIDTLKYPKADLHFGISGIKGSYLGSIIQLSNNISFEVSYGWNIGLFLLHPNGTHKIISLGANYHFHYFILNLTYAHFEEKGTYFSHIASINVELFSIDDPGIHLIGGIGGFYEFGKYFSNKPKEVGVNFDLALGFTIL